ncbi:uncharacterized protein MKK02DRAFT_33092 [Dioszegia hungarica]|uniref:Uncharacterized protein n=1 Tax=Dioszegia hungarica TaxID=4972 RepID=A0AA38H984_9TREE|nr:uncharacterized protein MKK02DRAFT_33092 [Dioszegia hungarica]KAI9635736.1 hypothetical protein MKK02DRAFT_33092 [Dioszegia hungarica]
MYSEAHNSGGTPHSSTGPQTRNSLIYTVTSISYSVQQPAATMEPPSSDPVHPQLPPEMWLRVIGHLQRPRPRPTGTNKPASIRQPDLATLMRCSKLFNNLTSTGLYTNVVSDHLPSLIYGINRPSKDVIDPEEERFNGHKHDHDPHLCADHRPSYVPGSNQRAAADGIKSKFELLRMTKRLYLEYLDKTEPTYERLMHYGGALYDLYQPTKAEMLRVCEAETAWIHAAAEKMEPVKPNLGSFSTGVYLGGQTDVWMYLEEHQVQPIAKAVSACAVAMLALAGNSKADVKLCNRAIYGPIRLASGVFPLHGSAPPSSVIHTAHVESYTGRENMLKDPSVWGSPAIYTLSFDIYLPAVMMKPVAQTALRKVIQDTARRTKMSMGIPESRYKDEWRLKSLDSAPMCEACFWDVSDLEAVVCDKYEPW